MDQTLKKQLEESRYLKKGIKPDLEDAAETRWLKKPVKEIKELSLTEDFYKIYLDGPGTLSLSRDKTISGNGSATITVPTTLAVKNDHNRAYACTELYRPLENENITHYNRLSVWIYVEAPGFHCLYLTMSVHNAGKNIMPTPGRFEGTHYPCLAPGEWHHVVWEIPYIYRDCVTAISMGVSLIGNLPEGAKETSVYFDKLQLEVVEEENYLGFDLRKDAIAYCHSGYRCGLAKQAVVQRCEQNRFILTNEQGQEVFSADARELKDGFKVLDFTSYDIPGRYTLHIGELSSQPFYIGDEAYLSVAWKTLSFFFTERCGADIPGVHSICHQDVMSVHPDGRKICVSGGWHDAGDLSQNLMKTMECAFAMLDLAQSVQHKENDLYERTLEEARWGLNWVMRSRFGDGYRSTGCLIGIWTDNIIGNKDDLTSNAQNNSIDNFMAAALCAKAARIYTDDPVFSNWCLKCATEDFEFARARIGMIDRGYAEVVFYSVLTVAGYELYATTGEKKYLDFSAHNARIVMSCQQKEKREDFSIPLRGFFYESPKKERALAFYHKSYEHTPMQALSCLYRAAPNHPDAPLWKEGLSLYGAYIKNTADLVPPYSILPSAIYELNNTDYSHFSHEGDHSLGSPSMEEYNEQVKNGIKLSDTHYLRRFPVAYQFRGFHATLLSKAKAAAYVSKALDDKELFNIAAHQAEWILGCNPYAASSVYGEGHDYPPLYVAFSNQLVGAVPVGFETFENLDTPFFPMQIAPTYKEIWGQTTCRLMWLIADLFE